jgi:hypothetical protein
MSKYQELLQNPPRLTVKKDAREVIIKTVSCMCDNVHYLKLKKNSEGDFKMSGGGFALSNWQMKHKPHDIEWIADEGKWNQVFRMINTGTEKIESLKSR